MVPLSESQRQAIEEAGWTEDEVQGFVEDVERFRGSLGDKQRAAFDAALARASDAVSDDDVSGFLVVPQIIGVVIAGPLLPQQQKAPVLKLSPPLPESTRPAAQ